MGKTPPFCIATGWTIPRSTIPTARCSTATFVLCALLRLWQDSHAASSARKLGSVIKNAITNWRTGDGGMSPQGQSHTFASYDMCVNTADGERQSSLIELHLKGEAQFESQKLHIQTARYIQAGVSAAWRNGRGRSCAFLAGNRRAASPGSGTRAASLRGPRKPKSSPNTCHLETEPATAFLSPGQAQLSP